VPRPDHVQALAGHEQGSVSERYIHAAQVLFPGAAERSEECVFSADLLTIAAAASSVREPR